jgi:hypothetical protein
MKKSVIIGMFCLAALSGFPQAETGVRTARIHIGRNFSNNTDMVANEYVFSNNIYSWNITDNSPIVTVQLRDYDGKGAELLNNGTLLQYDLQNKHLCWANKLNYSTARIEQYDTILLRNADNVSSCIKNSNGEIGWQSNNDICYVNPSRKIGIGYKYSETSGLTNRLEGIDLNTGLPIWKRNIQWDYGLNNIQNLNDSVILLAANGLHSINIKTGAGWNYDARTGKKDHTGTITANIVSFAFSAFLGTDFVLTTGHDLYSDIVSNILVNNNRIFMADKQSLFSLDFNGNVIWKKDLPAGLPSKSNLFILNDRLYMVNMGYAFLNGDPVSYGRAFVAAFDKTNGNKLFLNPLTFRKEQLTAFQTQQDTLYLLSKKRLYKYSLNDGVELWEQYYKTDSVGEITNFAGKDVYIASDSNFVHLMANDTAQLGLYTRKDKLMTLDNMLNTKATYPIGDLYFCYLEYKGYKFLENGNNTVVVDKNNKQVAELNISGNIALKGSILYEVQDNSMVEIDLNQFEKNDNPK